MTMEAAGSWKMQVAICQTTPYHILECCEFHTLYYKSFNHIYRTPMLNNLWINQSFHGPKRKEVTGGWRNLHNDEHNYLWFLTWNHSVILSRRMNKWCMRHIGWECLQNFGCKT